MAKSSSTGSKNLLRLSGMLYGVAGSFHIGRYFLKFAFRIGDFELTYAGSLVIGVLLALLSVACFMNAKD